MLRHPARRLRRAQRVDADEHGELSRRRRPRQAAPHSGARSPASMQNWVCAKRAPAATLALSAVGLPVGLRIDRHVGGADEERGGCATLRPVGSSPSSRSLRAVAISVCEVEIEHRLGVGLIAGLGLVAGEASGGCACRAPPRPSSRSAAPSGCGRGRSSCRIGSIPRCIEDRRGRDRAHMYARAPAHR